MAALIQILGDYFESGVIMSDHSEFPEGVRRISFDEMEKLGVEDATGKLFWGAHELEVKKVLSLRRYELILATIAAISAGGLFILDILRFCQSVQ